MNDMVKKAYVVNVYLTYYYYCESSPPETGFYRSKEYTFNAKLCLLLVCIKQLNHFISKNYFIIFSSNQKKLFTLREV